MSQHDYDVANAAGAGFRADVNAALLAVVSNNSGATEPATMFAHQWWADTTSGILKRRNAANNAWISVMSLATGLIIGTDVEAFHGYASQAEAEAGAENTKIMTALRVAQAIAALSGGSTEPTGVGKDFWGSTLPAGYIWASGKTIGNASSGGTERANADTSALFTLLWDSMANAEAPVSGGRGASAAADFAANKTITVPDKRGRTSAGKDNMGGTTASRLTSGGSGILGTTLGVAGGAETVALTSAQNGAHTHAQGAAAPTGNYMQGKGGGPVVVTQAATASSGSGTAHQNVPPTIVCNYIIKL